MLATVVDQSENKQRSRRVDRASFSGIRLRPAWAGAELEPVDLPTGRYTLGADDACDLSISMTGVADRHCVLVVGRKRVIVKAFSPLTWINEGVISESELKVGDRLILGPAEFSVESLVSQPSMLKSEEDFSPPGLDEIIQQSIQSSASTPPHVSTHREQLMEEMLADVQQMLDHFFLR